jgi:hypothetical protein
MSLVAPSLCTHGALRAYFQNGTLPAAGTVCEPDASAVLFPGAPNATANTNTTNAPKTLLATPADGKLLDAVRKIGDVVRPIAAMGRPL